GVGASYPARSGRSRRGLVVRFLSLAGWFVVAPALEPDGSVLLLGPVVLVVMGVLVALAVAELAQARMPGRLLQVQRHGIGRRRVLRGPAQRGDHAVGLGSAGQVDGSLGQVEPGFGKSDVLDGVGDGD